MTGEIDTTDDNVLVIRRIHVRYRLEVDEETDELRETVERVLGFHARKCPVARTIGDCVQVDTEVDLVAGA